ncbi:MAG: Sec-independent protein translocase protein TatB [Thiohalocapsa sp.]|nr:Sec-independent protein translocase protein TatB [Thiohalocapsa sp.]
MFDIGALELILIGVVALLVLGPERLPKVARTAGLWAGRARRALTSVKDEIDREIRAEELKEILRKQAESNPLETILEEDGSLSPKDTGKPAADKHAGASTPPGRPGAESDAGPRSGSGSESASKTGDRA